MAPKKGGKKASKPEVTLEQLQAVAEDFNSFMFASPDEGIPIDLEYKELLAEVTETADELETTDTLLPATADTLDLLGIDYSATIADEEPEADEPQAEEPKEEEENEPAPKIEATEEEEDEEAAKAADLALVKKTKDVEKMKGVAKAWKIRIPPPFYKDIDKLRAYLTGKLDESIPAPEKKEDAEKKEKKVGQAPQKVGVIAKIVEVISASGKKGVSKETILAELVKAFPSRDEKSMKNTINVQVPNRMSKEKFPIGKTKGGLFFKQ